MPVIGNVKYSTIRKNGQCHRVPAERNFYINYLIQSRFHVRIATLADRAEMKLRDAGIDKPFDRQKFYEAAGLAVYAHRKQKRKVDGAPYADHPIKLVERAVDLLHIVHQEVLLAGLLHDVVEDTEFNSNFIIKKFGIAVANLVDGVTKIEQIEKTRFISEENIDKFVAALSRDIRVLLIKMIDRGINLEDIEQLGRESLERNCQEALDFYVPLGILCGFMKAVRHLSDIAFKKLHPERHALIQGKIEAMVEKNQPLLDELKTKILQRNRKIQSEKRNELTAAITPELLGDPGVRRYLSTLSAVEVEIMSKPRTVYEVEQIATMRGTDAHNLSDIVMMQVTVENERDCYTMVDVINSLGIPIDRYSHDYVKDPKINGYQSLHTAVLVKDTLIRFQIRTNKMQRVAQEGILHDAYTVSGKFRQPKLPWLKADWLRIIRQVGDRRNKILLTKSLSQARLATVAIEGTSMNVTYNDVLLPRTISPLELAFITDPMVGLHLVDAFHQDISQDLHEPIREGIGFIRLRIGDDIQARDYLSILKNPLARLRLIEFLKNEGAAFRGRFAALSLKQELDKAFLDFGQLMESNPRMLESLLRQIADGELSGEKAVRQVLKSIENKDGEIIGLGRMVLETDGPAPLPGLNDISRIFSVNGYSRQGNRATYAFSFRSEAQTSQFDNLLGTLGREAGVKALQFDLLEPPILDRRVFNPDSVYYSHDLALRVAQALHRQEGSIIDLNLDPMLIFNLPQDNLREIGQIVREHIMTAGVLFLGGNAYNTPQILATLKKLMRGRIYHSPLLVVAEKRGVAESNTIIQQMAKVIDLPPLSITELGHRSDFILNCIAERLGLPVPA